MATTSEKATVKNNSKVVSFTSFFDLAGPEIDCRDSTHLNHEFSKPTIWLRAIEILWVSSGSRRVMRDHFSREHQQPTLGLANYDS